MRNAPSALVWHSILSSKVLESETKMTREASRNKAFKDKLRRAETHPLKSEKRCMQRSIVFDEFGKNLQAILGSHSEPSNSFIRCFDKQGVLLHIEKDSPLAHCDLR